MQKKIIALALASLASSAAFAQSNVTIYGIVDAGYSYRWDAEKPKTGERSRSSIDTGNSAGNRLGFKGVEDIGNGLKALFVLEQGFSFDTGAMGQSNTFFGRQSYLGLTGGFGSAIVGRIVTPYYNLTSAVDPFSAGTVGQYRNVWGGNGVSGSVYQFIDPNRMDNAVSYTSPNWGGFDVNLTFSSAMAPDNGGVSEDPGNNAKNNTMYSLLAKYAAGPVAVGFSTHRIAAGTTITNGPVATNLGLKTVDNYTLGGTYDAKVVKIAAMASHTNLDTRIKNGDMNVTNYLVGVTAPVGKFDIKASVNYSDGNHKFGGDATQYAVGLNYNLSKRTNLYSAYSLIDAQSTRAANTLRGEADSTAAGMAGTANPFQQGFQFGVRHQF